MSVYLLATLDTKGPEAAFVRDRLKELGLDVTLSIPAASVHRLSSVT